MQTLNKFKKIKSDAKLLAEIEKDMMENGGIYRPSDHWLNVDKKYLSLPKNKNLTNMLDDLIGSQGSRPPTKHDKKIYGDLFKVIDGLNLKDKLGKDSILTDFGSVMDINLIRIFCGLSSGKSNKILEIGGGYGRLAEVFFNVYKGLNKYVLVDAVPVSIMYSYLYLRAVLPKAKIGFYLFDEYDLDKYDIFIIPTWHFVAKNKTNFDIGVNIESFQEMNQVEVDRYMKIFDSSIDNNGYIYLSNAHDYVFKGDWNYPASWQCCFRYNTPRSWTINHPTEVYSKNKKDNTEINKTLAYFSDIESDRKSEVYGIEGHLKSRPQLESEIKELYLIVENRDKRILELDNELRKLREDM